MPQEIVSGLIGALAGAALTLAGAWYMQRRQRRERLLDEVRLAKAKELVQYLSRVLNREAPENLRNEVGQLRHQWAVLHRALYLLNAPEHERSQFDDRMMLYFDSLARLADDPSHRPEVERQRERAKHQARELLWRLGFVTDW